MTQPEWIATVRAAQDRARAAVAQTATEWYRITAEQQSGGGSRAKVYVYDVIGGWFGVAAADFVREINDLDVDDIELHLNSPGGSVWDGLAIRNALKQHTARVTTYVDGLAASAASVVALGGDEIIMTTGSQMMVHDASGLSFGNAGDMRDVADVLDKISNGLADIYAEKAGGDRASWRATMLAETWYDAAEAVEAGLADRVDTAKKADDDATAAFDLKIFAHAGRSHAPSPQATHNPPAAPAGPTNPPQEGTDNMSDTLTSGLRERLGIDAEAELDDNGLLAAVDEALAERAETARPAPGTTLIDSAVLADLQAKAARGDQAREQQETTDRERLVTAALNDGRITPASADDWRQSLKDTPQASAKLLASLARNQAVSTAAAGYTGGVDETSDDDRIYAMAWGDDQQKGA